MRLLEIRKDGTIGRTKDLVRDIPPYAILSHTWGSDDEEVLFLEMMQGRGREKPGFRKIRFCCSQAASDGLQYAWIDTCCIDRSSSAELTEAINSMFDWYQNAAKCYVYLSDVAVTDIRATAWKKDFRKSRWFGRGWTLQELLAPQTVEFYSAEWQRLGDKNSLMRLIRDITGIKITALEGTPLCEFDELERMSWSERRQTKREEDMSYALLGIFGVRMPLIYGEGRRSAAFRLREAIARQSGRHPDDSFDLNKTRQDKSESHFIVPFGRNTSFVGRSEDLQRLSEIVPPSANKQDCQRIVIEGLGGVGKTQLALETAYRIHENHSDCSIFWVPAINLASFDNAYREIGRVLNVPGIEKDDADVKALVKAQLSRESTGNWLLIIDNADDSGLLFDAAHGGLLRNSLPFSRKGAILFTTRNHEVTVRLDVATFNVIAVQEMSESEAMEMLHKNLSRAQLRDQKSTRELLVFLSCLPLAVRQASAYMARTGISTGQYLDYCNSSNATIIQLLSQEFHDRSRYDGIDNAIATTWLISFQHIVGTYPLAANYMKFSCFLAEKDIPIALLPPAANTIERDEAIGILKGYAFIIGRDGPESFDIHRLVRIAMRNWVQQEEPRQMDEVLRHLSTVYPFPTHDNRAVWLRYMPHVETALETLSQSSGEKEHWELISKSGMSHSRLGNYNQAEGRHRAALKATKSELGHEHPYTLINMNHLAQILGQQGKFKKAEDLHRETLDLKIKVLGNENPSTLTSMHNLSQILVRQGKFVEAEERCRQTLELSIRVWGYEHPNTLPTMSGLADILGQQGKLEEAEEKLREALELTIKAQGYDHPNALVSMHNLASALSDRGKLKEAEDMARKTLGLMREVLGSQHPDTLMSMNNLADFLRQQGKLEEAEELHRSTMESRVKLLGAEHPDTLISMNNLAGLLRQRGKLQEAEKMHRKNLGLRMRLLGSEHPDTLVSMMNLAEILQQQGRLQEAADMHHETLGLQMKVLGGEHPDTIISMMNLAVLWHQQKRFKQAKAMHLKTLDLKIKMFGDDHPSTRTSKEHLAALLEDMMVEAGEQLSEDMTVESGNQRSEDMTVESGNQRSEDGKAKHTAKGIRRRLKHATGRLFR